ncbi:MAG: repeat domain protein, partial [Deltaproteobacteria bacterium]|nr:repeat domain protein [Deltaproteobacteria bacterium]
MDFSIIGRKLPFLGVFIILLFLAEPSRACLPSPDPDYYAVLLSTADGTIIAAKAKVKAPGSEPLGSGELRAHLRYSLPSPTEGKKFHYAVSRVIPVDGLDKDASILMEFDFSEASIPADACHLTLMIYYQLSVDGVPLLISEYMPKQLVKETSEILIPNLPPLQGSVSIWGPIAFLREQGKPKTEQVSIPVSDPTGPFILRLINGSAEGNHRVSSATIRLNGQEVFKPCELNQRVRELNRQVTLLSGENLLEVKLGSAPGSQLSLELFRLEKNGCSAFDVHTFMRKRGKPIVKEEVFELGPEFVGPFTLNIFNGDLDGSNRVDSAIITLNGQRIFTPHDFNEHVEILSQIVTLQEKNVLSVELRGAPGDFLSIGISGYDHTPPKVEITRPSDAAIFTTSPIAVSGTVNDLTALVKVNGIPVPVASDGSFILEGVVLQEGENKIKVVAVDPCGNEGEDQIAVYLKNSIEGPPLRFCTQFSMPTIATTLEAEEEECRTQAYTVNVGRVSGITDETAVSITLNGIVLPDGVEVSDQGDIDYAFRDGTSFSARVKIPQVDGIYPFTAVAADSAGGRTEKVVVFIRDTVPPGIAITSPGDGWVTANPIVTVTGTMDDPQGTVRWGWEEPPIPVLNGSFTTQITLKQEGLNNILITAVDP